MIFKRKYLLLYILLIIIFQILLYTNNKQSTSFKYLKWSFQEVSLGKLMSISFYSGLFVSTILNNIVINYKNNTLENLEENYEPPNDKEDIKTNVKMPPQRDVRDNQPTISVNYRVVKNMEENNFKSNQNSSNNPDERDDWDNSDNGW